MINRLDKDAKKYTPHSLIRDLLEVTTLEGYPLTNEEQSYLLEQLQDQSLTAISLACIPEHKHDLITAILNEKGIKTERSTYHLHLIRQALTKVGISLPQEKISAILDELLEIEAGTYNKFTFPAGLSDEAEEVITQILNQEKIGYIGSTLETTRTSIDNVFGQEANQTPAKVDRALDFWLS